jgi:tRNA-modifying protein YgfZ
VSGTTVEDEGYSALRDGFGALRLGRDIVRVAGPDAESYLQGQTSQDVAKLGDGGWAWALVLQPQGKLDAFVRVFRLGPAEFLLDTDSGMGPALVARLGRFKLRTKVDIEQLDWQVVAVRGTARPELPASLGESAAAVGNAAPGGAAPGSPAPGGSAPGSAANDGATVTVPFEWGGLAGYDLFGPTVEMPPGATPVDAAAYEAVRVEAGFPRHGDELDERTIPAEAGLVEASVSFTKGCYTGQELVARIDSRGSNVPRHLRGLLLSGPVEPGARLVDFAAASDAASGTAGSAGKEVGRLTSVARSPRLGWVGLGYVGRSVAPEATLSVRDEGDQGGDVEARVQLLPLSGR